MHRGYIKFWRRAADSRSWNRGLAYQGLLINLLCRAAWRPSSHRGVDLAPGQFAASVSALADSIGVPRTTLQRMMAHLEEDGFLRMEKTGKRFFLFSIMNWRTYQGDEQNFGQQTSAERTANGHEDRLLPKRKKKKEGKKQTLSLIRPFSASTGRPCDNTQPRLSGIDAGSGETNFTPLKGDQTMNVQQTSNETSFVIPDALPEASENCDAEHEEREMCHGESVSRSDLYPRSAPETPEVQKPAARRALALKRCIDEYTADPLLRKRLDEYRMMRERLKKPLTEAALALTLRDLDRLSLGEESAKIALLEQSIQRSWQGIFPLRSPSSMAGFQTIADRRLEANMEAGRLARELLFGSTRYEE